MRSPGDMTLVEIFEELIKLFKLSIADASGLTFKVALARQLRYEALMSEVKRRDEALTFNPAL